MCPRGSVIGAALRDDRVLPACVCPANPAQGQPCQNGGSCIGTPNDMYPLCECREQFTGPLCEVPCPSLIQWRIPVDLLPLDGSLATAACAADGLRLCMYSELCSTSATPQCFPESAELFSSHDRVVSVPFLDAPVGAYLGATGARKWLLGGDCRQVRTDPLPEGGIVGPYACCPL